MIQFIQYQVIKDVCTLDFDNDTLYFNFIHWVALITAILDTYIGYLAIVASLMHVMITVFNMVQFVFILHVVNGVFQFELITMLWISRMNGYVKIQKIYQ